MAGFLQTAFQSNTADNTASKISLVNSSSTPLGIAGIYTGQFENCSSYGLIQVNVSTDQDCTLYVKQSYLGTAENIVATSEFAIVGSDNPLFTGNTKYVYITYPFFRVELVNTSGIAQTSLYLSSKMTSTPPASAGGVEVPLNPVDDGVAVYGSAGAGPVVIKTDTDGVVAVNIVGGGAPSVVAIQGSEDLTFAQTVTTGRMIVVGAEDIALATETTLGDIYNSMLPAVLISSVAGPVTGVAFTALTSGFDLYENSLPKYTNVTLSGIITDVVIASPPNPYLSLQFSIDGIIWLGDGLFPTLLQLANGGSRYSFVFQRQSCPMRYVRGFCMTTCTITDLSIILWNNR